MTKTGRPTSASAAATLTVVVVLPTPPFWLATAITRTTRLPPFTCDYETSRIEVLDLHNIRWLIEPTLPADMYLDRSCLNCGQFGGSFGQFVRNLLALQNNQASTGNSQGSEPTEETTHRGNSTGSHDVANNLAHKVFRSTANDLHPVREFELLDRDIEDIDPALHRLHQDDMEIGTHDRPHNSGETCSGTYVNDGRLLRDESLGEIRDDCTVEDVAFPKAVGFAWTDEAAFYAKRC